MKRVFASDPPGGDCVQPAWLLTSGGVLPAVSRREHFELSCCHIFSLSKGIGQAEDGIFRCAFPCRHWPQDCATAGKCRVAPLGIED